MTVRLHLLTAFALCVLALGLAIMFASQDSAAGGNDEPWLVPTEVTLKDGRVVQCVGAPTGNSPHVVAVTCDFNN